MSLCKKQDVTLCPACLIYKSGNRQTLEINLQNEILVPTAWSHRFSRPLSVREQTRWVENADVGGSELWLAQTRKAWAHLCLLLF